MSASRPASATTRRRILIGLCAALAWAVQTAGVGDDIVNSGGWPSFRRFWGAIASPELGGTFVRLTIEAAGVTLAFAVLGTVLALVLGSLGGLVLSELLWEGRRGRWFFRALFTLPRAVHEVLWALLLIQFLGFDPMVAVLAIGVPFGAVTAKVFAETIDDADAGPYRLLRASGASRLAALSFAIVPNVKADLISYGFYRLECAIRSAAVLGVIGAGGLGFQLDLSFQSLRYGEIWTLIAALMVLSGLADGWSARVRHGTGMRIGTWSMVVVAVLVPFSWRWTGIDPGSLWSERTRRLAVEFGRDLLPPRLGPGGFGELFSASIETLAMSVLATTIAIGGAVLLGTVASRPRSSVDGETLAGRVSRLVVRTTLLLLRAVPAPMWAFVFVLVLFPGMWPGAVALGIYNLGVVGRLFAETFEDTDPAPARVLAVSGASPTERFAYATFPAAGPRLVSIGLYRWEVILRETVVVGVVGAGGLGRLAQEHLAARDFPAVLGVVGALVVLSLGVDTIGALLRRTLRVPG
ncbi:MAG: ABC transporter permease subunit [Acidimicrobiales bacterium]